MRIERVRQHGKIAALGGSPVRSRLRAVWARARSVRDLSVVSSAASFATALTLTLAAPIALSSPAAAQTQLSGAATLMADRVDVDPSGRLIASGAVEVWHGSIRLSAARVIYDRRLNSLSIEGPITISDGPDVVTLADAAQLSQELRTGLITSARVVLDQQLQISAARIQRHANGVSQMDAVVASSCPVCASNPTPLWEVRADRVTHDSNTRQLTFEHAQMRFAGVPVFYLPRLRLPAPGNDRTRGVLLPVMHADSNLGVSIGLPYFIPFGQDRDLTLTPVVSSDRMVSLGMRWRQAFSNGGIELGGQISRDQIIPGRLRGYGYARALFDLRNDFRLSGAITAPSDRTYLETYDISSDSQLNAHLTLERYRRDQAIRARALGFYSLRAADDNRTLPTAALQAALDQRHSLAQTLVGGELRTRMGATAFWRRSHTDGDLGRDVARAYASLDWRRSEVLAGGILMTGALSGRADHVRISDDTTYPDPVNRLRGQAMLEFRWPWARSASSGARTTIEPILQLIGARGRGGALPNDDHTMPELDEGNLFALRRYSGQDAPDHGSRINAGVQWTRYAPGGWETSAVLGRIWRDPAFTGFDPTHRQPLGRVTSDWLLAARARHSNGFSWSMRLLMNDAADLSRAETNLAWSNARTELSTRYLYMPAASFENRTNEMSRWNLDFAHSFASGWRTSIGWEYDISQAGFVSANTGLEYRNECLSVNFTMSRDFVTATNPTASNSYNLRVELLGLGGSASGNSARTCRA